MKHLLCIFAILGFFLVLGLQPGCQSKKEISDFTSDGCSLFPDRSVINNEDWCECCFQHDVLYWQGGTESERLEADLALKTCILGKTGDKYLAATMYSGVRFGGSPYFYNWYRWGYGWSYDRKYFTASEEDRQQIKLKLDKYYANYPDNPCD